MQYKTTEWYTSAMVSITNLIKIRQSDEKVIRFQFYAKTPAEAKTEMSRKKKSDITFSIKYVSI